MATQSREQKSGEANPQPERLVAPRPSGNAVARAARQRLWAAEVACYYAQKRFSQTSTEADRRFWQDAQQEVRRAVTALEAAEQALLRSGAASPNS